MDGVVGKLTYPTTLTKSDHKRNHGLPSPSTLDAAAGKAVEGSKEYQLKQALEGHKAL